MAGSHITSVAYLKSFVERSGAFHDVVETEIWVPVVSLNGSSTFNFHPGLSDLPSLLGDAQERRIADQFRPALVVSIQPPVYVSCRAKSLNRDS
jgi:hypothetical protein